MRSIGYVATLLTVALSGGCKGCKLPFGEGDADAGQGQPALAAASAGVERWTIYCSGFPEGNPRDNCWLRAGAISGDASLCANARDLEGDCLTYVARATSDSAPCARASDPRTVFACVMGAAILAKKPSVCAPFEEREALARRCSEKETDRAACAMWTGPMGEHALAACKAVVTTGAAGCEALPRDDGAREECLNAVAIRTRDPAVCQKLRSPGSSSPAYQEDKCVVNAAVVARDEKACAWIADDKQDPTGNFDRMSCLMAAAGADPSICDRLPPTDNPSHAPAQKALCLTAARVGAASTGVRESFLRWTLAFDDEASCKLASADDTCLLTVALNTRRGDGCAAILAPATRDACEKLAR